ncbi:hypothetical protein BSL78_16441 [Apostichopus japonicus]|uniref:Uncharacterized protein n=1 Tax=Stichopus japonicus TaxID=307972 RepID=A0A2G8KFC9_STIJA|nr:hypothetical protein BSL78_16441 [Apostichopus japonicus]
MCHLRRKARVEMLNNPTAANKNNCKTYNKKVKYRLAGEKSTIQAVAKHNQGFHRTAPDEVMKCWEDHFNKHLNTEFPRDDDILKTIPEPVNRNTTRLPFTVEEVEEAVKKLINNKACGCDRISAEVLKEGGPLMNQMLLKVINKAWSDREIPEDWSRGLVTPVYKKGDKLDPANYRAITLLSIPGKVFCRRLLTRIKDTVENHLSEKQCGFRASRGTTDAIFTVRQIFEKAKERKYHFTGTLWTSKQPLTLFGGRLSGNACAQLE